MALLTRGLTVCLPARLAPSRFRARALPLARFSAYASADVPELNSRVYTSYDVFKGRSALNVKVIAPTFSQSGGGALTLKKVRRAAPNVLFDTRASARARAAS